MKLNPEVIEELETLYETGLNNMSTQDNKKVVADLAARRHVDEDQVKRWIANRRRRGCKRKRHPLPRATQSSAYYAFMRETLKGLTGEERNAAMKTAGTRWKRARVDIEYVAQLYERDMKYRESVHENLSEKQKLCSAMALNEKAFKIIEDLEHLGYEAVFAASNGEKNVSCKSGKVDKAFSDEVVGMLVRDVFTKNHSSTLCEDRNMLRKRVSRLLNEKYHEAFPQSARSTIPYSHPTSYIVMGMPPGVLLKNPGAYGKEVLKTILNYMPQIQFKRPTAQSTITTPLEEEQVQTYTHTEDPETSGDERPTAQSTITTPLEEEQVQTYTHTEDPETSGDERAAGQSTVTEEEQVEINTYTEDQETTGDKNREARIEFLRMMDMQESSASSGGTGYYLKLKRT